LTEVEGWLQIPAPSNQDVIRLHRRAWLPETTARAALLLVHGLGEHSGRYGHVADVFTANGYAVHAVDHVGHGRSEGTRGHADAFDQYVDGVDALLAHVRERHPDRPLFLVGHSMGGLIAAHYLLCNQSAFAGCVLSGPLIRSDAEPPRLVLGINRLVAAIAPKIGMLALDATAVSRDPAVVERYTSDPLVHHGKVSARLVHELFVAMAGAIDRAADITLPLLILHGGADRLTSLSGSELLHERVGSQDKTLTVFPGLYHEIFNEPERDRILAEAHAWIEAHMPRNA